MSVLSHFCLSSKWKSENSINHGALVYNLSRCLENADPRPNRTRVVVSQTQPYLIVSFCLFFSDSILTCSDDESNSLEFNKVGAVYDSVMIIF